MRRTVLNRPLLPILALLAVSLSACASTRPATARDWVFLGQREVTDQLDRDRITVTARRGEFRSLKLTVSRASVDFHRVVIAYGNGDRDEIDLRARIPAGGETRAIDLPGRERVIRSIQFFYDANTLRGRQAVVRVYGMR